MVARNILLHKLREDSHGQTDAEKRAIILRKGNGSYGETIEYPYLQPGGDVQTGEEKRALLRMYINDYFDNKIGDGHPPFTTLSKNEINKMIEIGINDLLEKPFVKHYKLPGGSLPEGTFESRHTWAPGTWPNTLHKENTDLDRAVYSVYANIVDFDYTGEHFKDYIAAETEEERMKVRKYWNDNKKEIFFDNNEEGYEKNPNFNPWEDENKAKFEKFKASKYYPVVKYRNRLG